MQQPSVRPPNAEQLEATERWFVRRGIPQFIHRYNASEDIFTRALPVLLVVFLFGVVGATDLDWPWWGNTLAVLAGLAILIGAWTVLNVARDRRPLAPPSSVGTVELAAFVLIPAVLPLIFGGSLTGAAATIAINLGVLATIYLVTSFGLVAILLWALRQAVRSFRSTWSLFARALPLLLLGFMFLFVNAEAWQSAGRVERPLLIAVVVLFAGLAAAFVITRLPREIGTLEHFTDWETVHRLSAGSPLQDMTFNAHTQVEPPPLTRPEWANLGLVVLFTQGLQIVIVSALIGGFFVSFGLLVVRPETIAAWTGAEPTLWWNPLTVFGQELQLTAELVQVSAFLAAFAGLYFSVYAVTDATFREEFYDDIAHDARQALAVRAAYLSAMGAASGDGDFRRAVTVDGPDSQEAHTAYSGAVPSAENRGVTSMNEQMLKKIREEDGFIAALDQSGGSTPKALRAYGLDENAYAGEDEMFDVIHAMRTRIVTSSSFNGDRILGAILFENTMDRDIEGQGSAEFLWNAKRVVPFLKVDKGLAEETNGAQVMKPIPGLDDLLERAKAKGVFGTKMRSVIKLANPEGVNAVVDQQFEIGKQILGHGLVPIIEPEIDIHSPEKAEAEALLKARVLEHLDQLAPDELVMLKLTLPEEDNYYAELINHPNVLKVVALSGGYSREEANARLARNNGMVASFSRALTEGLSAQQSEGDFDTLLDSTIGSIFEASKT